MLTVNSPCGGAIPVPVSDTDWGDPPALSAMSRLPASDPVAVGENVTLTVQFAPAARVLEQVVVAA
jgi:hypothetical protein